MTKRLWVTAVLLVTLATGSAAGEPSPQVASFRIVGTDPPPAAALAVGERLHLRIRYESPEPIRFMPEGIRQGIAQEHVAASSAPPYDPGRGEALAWLAMAAPVRIDEIRVTAYDLEWRKLGVSTVRATITWDSRAGPVGREPAEWVEPMLKHHRRVFDTALDPLPEKPEPLLDIFFMISFTAIPLYLLMQAQMLLRYRGKWQWYAAAPLLPIIPLGLYSLIGLGLSTQLWVKFLFHYMAVALLYLLTVWAVKWHREKGLRARRRAQPVDSSSGTE